MVHAIFSIIIYFKFYFVEIHCASELAETIKWTTHACSWCAKLWSPSSALHILIAEIVAIVEKRDRKILLFFPADW